MKCEMVERPLGGIWRVDWTGRDWRWVGWRESPLEEDKAQALGGEGDGEEGCTQRSDLVTWGGGC